MLRTCLFAAALCFATAAPAATLSDTSTAGGVIEAAVENTVTPAPDPVLDASAARFISTASGTYGGYYPPPPPPPSEVPIPGAIALMGSVLVGGAGLGAWRRRRQKVADVVVG